MKTISVFILIIALQCHALADAAYVQGNSAVPQSDQRVVPVVFQNAHYAERMNLVFVVGGTNATFRTRRFGTDLMENVYSLAPHHARNG